MMRDMYVYVYIYIYIYIYIRKVHFSYWYDYETLDKFIVNFG